MKTSLLVATAFAVLAATAAPAFAKMDPSRFPMPAAQFQAHVERRIHHVQRRLEKEIAEGQVPADQAGALRAQFDLAASRVRAEVNRAVADGTVTFDEANAVREAARELRRLVHRPRGEAA